MSNDTNGTAIDDNATSPVDGAAELSLSGEAGASNLTAAFLSYLAASSRSPEVANEFLELRTFTNFLKSTPAQLSDPFMTTGACQMLVGILFGAITVHLLVDTVVLGSLAPGQRKPAVDYNTIVDLRLLRGNLQPLAWLLLLSLLVVQFLWCADHPASILSLLYFFVLLCCLPKVALARRRLARASRTTVPLAEEDEKALLIDVGYSHFMMLPVLLGLVGCQQWAGYSGCSAGGFYVTTRVLLEMASAPTDAAAEELLSQYELYEDLLLSLLVVFPVVGAASVGGLWLRAARRNRDLPCCAKPALGGGGGGIGSGGGAAAASPKLPKEWKEVKSEQGTYYYNSKTKETSWDRPGGVQVAATADVSLGVPPPGTPPPSADAAFGAPPPSPGAPTPLVLEPPAIVAPPPAPGGGRASCVMTRISAPAPPPPGPPPMSGALPDGWEEVATADGDTYFWNAETGASSWERPVAA